MRMRRTAGEQKNVTAYQFAYKQKGKKKWTIKTAKTQTKTIAKLKNNKTYLLKARTYKKIDGKTYYGEWSAAKKIKARLPD